MIFVDQVEVFVRGGRGGDGRVSFHREKFVPRGGPDGGDGGDGGDVVLEASHSLATLYDFRHQVHYRATDGEKGGNNNCAGAGGDDLVVRVPPGTVIRDRESGIALKDLDRDGARVVIARGGRGGRGNWHFRTASHQTPTESEPGRDPEERWLQLELKLIADVGLVGRPNAGKSTLLSRISSARPRIAGYPFTTLQPVLGIVTMGPMKTAVFADIPGLIEGAHAGAGLGDWFLRHVERTRVLLHLVDLAAPDGTEPRRAYREIRSELKAHSAGVAGKAEIIVATKMDVPEARARLAAFRRSLPKDRKMIPISAATGEGLKALLAEVAKALEEPQPSRTLPRRKSTVSTRPARKSRPRRP